jgi:hypothetical protein
MPSVMSERISNVIETCVTNTIRNHYEFTTSVGSSSEWKRFGTRPSVFPLKYAGFVIVRWVFPFAKWYRFGNVTASSIGGWSTSISEDTWLEFRTPGIPAEKSSLVSPFEWGQWSTPTSAGLCPPPHGKPRESGGFLLPRGFKNI